MVKLFDIKSCNTKQTKKIAKKFAKTLSAKDIVLLEGDLGAGKTVFASGIVSAFSKKKVTSPTFSILNVYDGRIPVYHFDFYRLKDKHEIESFGAEEYLFGNGISVVEWPSRASYLFDNIFYVFINKIDENARNISIFEGKYEEFKHFVD